MEKIMMSEEQFMQFMRDIGEPDLYFKEHLINAKVAGYIKASAIEQARNRRINYDSGADLQPLLDLYERAYTEEHEARLAAEAKLKPILEMLFKILAAWKYEADQGDGIMEEHSKLFDAANAMLKEYKK
jgi:hypothetical protein